MPYPHSLSLRGPHRGLLFAGLGLLVALVLVATVASKRSSEAAPTTDQTRLGPVILVPGYGGGTGSLDKLAGRLRAAGRTATVLQLAGDGTGDLLVEARRLKAAADAALAAGAPSVDVVGYSAGGVVARLWAAELGGAAHARRVVLLGSPDHGTDVAALGAALGGSLCPAACSELAPDSDLLHTLNAGDETPAGPQWVSIWTDQDQVVTPPDSARLDGAVDVVVQDVCPNEQVDHGSLPTDRAMQGLVLRALAVPLMTAPSATDCAAVSS
jgi:triacylglycerol lipase